MTEDSAQRELDELRRALGELMEVTAALNSPLVTCVMPRKDVATTSIERSPRVRPMLSASCPDLTASS